MRAISKMLEIDRGIILFLFPDGGPTCVSDPDTRDGWLEANPYKLAIR